MEGEKKQKQQQPNNVVDKEKEKSSEAKKCPRCGSFNTKFCYYNNYSMSQPRHLCKACKRYWTQGGILRSVPIGASSRKSKRAKTNLISPLKTLNYVAPCQLYPGPNGYMPYMPFAQNITCFGQSSQMGSGDIVSNLGILQGYNAFSSMTYPSVDHYGMFFPLTRPTSIMTNWTQSFINNTQASTSNVAASTSQTAPWSATIGNNTNSTNGENLSY